MDWRFFRKGTYVGLTIMLFVAANFTIVPFYLYPSDDRLWLDAHVYYRATEAWLSGANPWLTEWYGVPYSAPPPALLLNLPLMPFGETFAVAFWVTANSISVGVLLRRFRLPLWWALFHPIFEGYLAASPDITLAALVIIGGGSLAALMKPYSIPAMLAANRWRAVLLAAGTGLVSVPLLPWATFLNSRDLIGAAFRDYAVPVSAFGSVGLMLVTAIALLSLGRVPGLALTTPGLLAQQPHYNVFSLQTIARSRILTWTLGLPVEHMAAFGVVAYAVADGYRRHGSKRLDGLIRS